jgi:hypothetical protein
MICSRSERRLFPLSRLQYNRPVFFRAVIAGFSCLRGFNAASPENACRGPLRSIQLPSGRARSRSRLHRLSWGFRVSQRQSARAVPAIWFTGPFSALALRKRLAPKVFRPALSPPDLWNQTVLPFTDFGPLQRLPRAPSHPRYDGKPSYRSGDPPMRFSAPPAFEHGESAYRPVPPGTPSLFGLSQTLEGLILTAPCGLVACR